MSSEGALTTGGHSKRELLNFFRWKIALINSVDKTTFVLYLLVRMTSMMGGGTSPGGAGGAASIFQA